MTSHSGTDREWMPIIASVLELDEARVADQAGRASFVALGGTSLRAVEYAARLLRECHRAADVAALLGTAPLATTAPGHSAASRPHQPAGGDPLHDLTIGQENMLASELLFGGTAFHLLFSADIHGQLDIARMRSAIRRLARRSPAMRTVFVQDTSGRLGRRVIPSWEPVVITQRLPGLGAADAGAADPVTVAHSLIAPSTGSLLRPHDQPPVLFIVSQAGPGRTVLSVLAHHALFDGWAIGLLWRELAAGYAAADEASAPRRAEVPAECLVALERTDRVEQSVRRRAQALAGWPTTVDLPTDLRRPSVRSMAGARLTFQLSEAAKAGCAQVAQELGLTRNAILLGAWALVIARRAATPQLLIGVASASRTTTESMHTLGSAVKLLPVCCTTAGQRTVEDYLRTTATALGEALRYADVPFESLVNALAAGGDTLRPPLIQFAFGAHDELVPAAITAGDITLHLREGFCGGTAFQAILYVQRWDGGATLALEYNAAALRGDEAAALALAVDRTLAEFAEGCSRPLADVRTMSQEQCGELISSGLGPPADTSADLWQLLEDVARTSPSAIAVRDSDPTRTLTYQQLLTAAEKQSAALAAAGVKPGDRIALAVRRSAREVIAISAALRLGVAYTGLEPDIPPAVVARMLDIAQIRVVLGDLGRLAALGSALDGRTAVAIRRPDEVDELPAPPPVSADPARAAYIAFTSGSTGEPKGTQVSRRAVVRLARAPRYLRPGATQRFMRLAPLAFDASTLEIFAPLLNGGTIEVFPGSHVTPDALAQFVQERKITGLWLTAGLFRLAADYVPAGFAGVQQILTGGDVVPAPQVARVLRACPGLRISNGYGPTENTTFTTVHHVDDVAAVADPLPIGRPIQGTGVLVLDDDGRLVPPGGIGELFAYGDGLADGYLGLPEQTAHAFGRFSPDSEHLLYRTGDLVRWNTAGRLEFIGRRDGQVKIRGFRVDLDDLTRVLRQFEGVRDAVVVATRGPGDRRLVAGVVISADPPPAEALRAYAAEHLPGYAVPSLWAFVSELPVTPNGKVDAVRLTELAKSRDPVRAAFIAERRAGSERARVTSNIPPGQHDHDVPVADPVVAAVEQAWQEALGRHDRIDTNARFFDIGGDSLNLLRVHASLRRRLPRVDLTVQDLYRNQTIATQVSFVRTFVRGEPPRPSSVGPMRPGAASADGGGR
jgi:amino acid adenylation domain-containing protein